MASPTTRISDLPIVAEVVTENVINRSLETNAFVQSGVLARDAALDAFLSGDIGGKTISPRYIGPLAQDDPNISSDDPAVKATPSKITGGRNTAVRQSLNKSWSSMDLAAALLGADPIGAITNMIGDYWSGVQTRRLLASLKGVVGADLARGKALAVDITGESGKDALFDTEHNARCEPAFHELAFNIAVNEIQLFHFHPRLVPFYGVDEPGSLGPCVLLCGEVNHSVVMDESAVKEDRKGQHRQNYADVMAYGLHAGRTNDIRLRRKRKLVFH